MIAVIDYRAGNIASVKKALDYLHADAVVTRDPNIVAQADKIILPGVGHFLELPFWNKMGCVVLFCAESKTVCRFSAYALVCSGCLNRARRHRERRAWGCCRESAVPLRKPSSRRMSAGIR